MTVAGRPAPAGSIYDLGYRHYDGPRLGRRHAVASLFRHTLRSCYGIGRGGRAKIAPLILAGLAIIPAIIAVGFIGLANQAGAGQQLAEASPIRYDTYFSFIATIVMLFVAAQAPELVGRDQRYAVLSLYFSRALRRTDYALAKFAGLVAALLVLLLVPQAVIFLGLVLSARDLAAALGDNLTEVPPLLAQGFLTSVLLAGLALAISSFTPRRAYATVAIIAALIVPPIVVGVTESAVGGELATWAVLLSVSNVLEGTNALLFGADTAGGDRFLAAAIAGTVISVGVLVRRYQRIAA